MKIQGFVIVITAFTWIEKIFHHYSDFNYFNQFNLSYCIHPSYSSVSVVPAHLFVLFLKSFEKCRKRLEVESKQIRIIAMEKQVGENVSFKVVELNLLAHAFKKT